MAPAGKPQRSSNVASKPTLGKLGFKVRVAEFFANGLMLIHVRDDVCCDPLQPWAPGLVAFISHKMAGPLQMASAASLMSCRRHGANALNAHAHLPPHIPWPPSRISRAGAAPAQHCPAAWHSRQREDAAHPARPAPARAGKDVGRDLRRGPKLCAEDNPHVKTMRRFYGPSRSCASTPRRRPTTAAGGRTTSSRKPSNRRSKAEWAARTVCWASAKAPTSRRCSPRGPSGGARAVPRRGITLWCAGQAGRVRWKGLRRRCKTPALIGAGAHYTVVGNGDDLAALFARPEPDARRGPPAAARGGRGHLRGFHREVPGVAWARRRTARCIAPRLFHHVAVPTKVRPRPAACASPCRHIPNFSPPTLSRRTRSRSRTDHHVAIVVGEALDPGGGTCASEQKPSESWPATPSLSSSRRDDLSLVHCGNGTEPGTQARSRSP